LPVQGHVIRIFGNEHLRQETRRRDALVDNVGRHRRLDQGLALIADPFAAHMAFDRKDTWLIIELLGDVFADAL
jgi:hypothetical protein